MGRYAYGPLARPIWDVTEWGTIPLKERMENNMKNIRNYGMVTGRLAKDLEVYNNRGGSRKILMLVAAQDNYTGRDGKRNCQFIPLEAFVPSGQKDNGVFEYLGCGDLVSCSYSVRNNTYTDKDGKTVYNNVLQIEEVALLESRAAKEARQADRDRAAGKKGAGRKAPAS